MRQNKYRLKCQHGRQRNKCVECDGVGICEHNRLRVNCRNCGGSRFVNMTKENINVVYVVHIDRVNYVVTYISHKDLDLSLIVSNVIVC